jgi:hypothetical protein
MQLSLISPAAAIDIFAIPLLYARDADAIFPFRRHFGCYAFAEAMWIIFGCPPPPPPPLADIFDTAFDYASPCRRRRFRRRHRRRHAAMPIFRCFAAFAVPLFHYAAFIIAAADCRHSPYYFHAD